MPSLITGGSGTLGSELARLLVNAGEEVVLFSRTMDTKRIKGIADKVKCVKGDLQIAAHVTNAIKDNRITDIYHIGATLAYASEHDPSASFQTNVIGTINILEAARKSNARNIMFASSIATFGLELDKIVSDITIQRPVFFYGIGKLYCEGIGRYYRNRYGLDFRSVRYGAIVSPGVKTPGHWIPPMIEDAVLGVPHISPVSSNASNWIISIKDAAKAAHIIMKAPQKRIKMVNYNVAGCTAAIKAKEVATAIKKRIPDAIIHFNNDPNKRSTKSGYSGNLDDHYARREWNWKPDHDTIDLIVEAFIENMEENPGYYESKASISKSNRSPRTRKRIRKTADYIIG
jgi:nucleoside-diphosphate-sugar epimerase